jgi:hypothetical protein
MIDWDVHSRDYRIGYEAGMWRGWWFGLFTPLVAILLRDLLFFLAGKFS